MKKATRTPKRASKTMRPLNPWTSARNKTSLRVLIAQWNKLPLALQIWLAGNAVVLADTIAKLRGAR